MMLKLILIEWIMRTLSRNNFLSLIQILYFILIITLVGISFLPEIILIDFRWE